MAAVDKVDVIVIGAGVVGLACARALALAGREVVVLEADGAYGQGVSSRSSEVIHGGMYYAAGSLKARLCVEGRQRLYAYCAERGVPHRRCGKLIVATGPDDGARLDTIAERARVNGVHDLERLSAAEAVALEPALACHGALLSPSTGIVDSHGLMTALLGDAENAGAMLALRSPFVRAERDGAFWRVATGGAEPFEIGAGWIVNAAGLGAQAAAAAMAGFPTDAIPPLWKAKGRYFALPSKAPFTRLIYPTPIDGGLGVHLTLDLGGQARFGPDVQWLAPDAPFDYEVDPALRSAFEADVRRYWPGLPAGALQPAYAGVRPKVDGPGTTPDFVIAGPRQHGVPGVVQLFGIESPGLTSSLAIAEFVLDLARGAAAS
jgi:L-2-hydroxyglutarate oxidase LhgO